MAYGHSSVVTQPRPMEDEYGATIGELQALVWVWGASLA
jgi:hypothetical protein